MAELDEAGFRPELFAAVVLFLAPDADVFEAADLGAAFCALPADADLVSPDLLPLPSPAFGALLASLAPAVFLGAADFDPVELFVDEAFAAVDFDPVALLLDDAFAEAGFDDVPAFFEPEPFAGLFAAAVRDDPADPLAADGDIASITETAAPDTAPEAAPAKTSPTTSLVLS